MLSASKKSRQYSPPGCSSYTRRRESWVEEAQRKVQGTQAAAALMARSTAPANKVKGVIVNHPVDHDVHAPGVTPLKDDVNVGVEFAPRVGASGRYDGEGEGEGEGGFSTSGGQYDGEGGYATSDATAYGVDGVRIGGHGIGPGNALSGTPFDVATTSREHEGEYDGGYATSGNVDGAGIRERGRGNDNSAYVKTPRGGGSATGHGTSSSRPKRKFEFEYTDDDEEYASRLEAQGTPHSVIRRKVAERMWARTLSEEQGYSVGLQLEKIQSTITANRIRGDVTHIESQLEDDKTELLAARDRCIRLKRKRRDLNQTMQTTDRDIMECEGEIKAMEQGIKAKKEQRHHLTQDLYAQKRTLMRISVEEAAMRGNRDFAGDTSIDDVRTRLGILFYDDIANMSGEEVGGVYQILKKAGFSENVEAKKHCETADLEEWKDRACTAKYDDLDNYRKPGYYGKNGPNLSQLKYRLAFSLKFPREKVFRLADDHYPKRSV